MSNSTKPQQSNDQNKSSYKTWFAKQVQEGIAAVKNGDVVLHDEAKERIRNLGIKIK